MNTSLPELKSLYQYDPSLHPEGCKEFEDKLKDIFDKCNGNQKNTKIRESLKPLKFHLYHTKECQKLKETSLGAKNAAENLSLAIKAVEKYLDDLDIPDLEKKVIDREEGIKFIQDEIELAILPQAIVIDVLNLIGFKFYNMTIHQAKKKLILTCDGQPISKSEAWGNLNGAIVVSHKKD